MLRISRLVKKSRTTEDVTLQREPTNVARHAEHGPVKTYVDITK